MSPTHSIGKSPATITIMGGGSLEELRPSLLDFLGELPVGKPLLFAPQAATRELYPDYMELVGQMLTALGEKRELKILDPLMGVDATTLKEAAGVWLGGGNTFLLMDAMHRARFDQTLLEYLNLGGAIAGNSAGAIVLGRDIRYAHDPNEVGLVDFRGLNLLHGYTLWCHYDSQIHDDEIRAFLAQTGFPVLALPGGAGIVWKEDQGRVCGSLPIVLWNRQGHRSISPGGPIPVRDPSSTP